VQSGGSSRSDEHCYLTADQVTRQLGQARRFTIRPTEFDNQILAVNKAAILNPLMKPGYKVRVTVS
jgi:hypothetical protein